MPFQPITPLLQRTIARNCLPHNFRPPFSSTGLPLLTPRIQIANLVLLSRVYVKALTDYNEPFRVKVTHRLPPDVLWTNNNEKKKTYEIAYMLGKVVEDDSGDRDAPLDVCWRFQVLEGEDELDRLLHYAQTFEKHGKGNGKFGEYYQAFQKRIDSLCDMRREEAENGGEIRKRAPEVQLEWEFLACSQRRRESMI